MKKLLCSAAVCGLALAANPAQAASDGLKLDIGGYFKGYMAWVDQDEATGSETNSFDIIRDTEVKFSGETTLDNGLTVGVHIEGQADGGDSFSVDETYAYFSGGWGRVNFGEEDGAAYLLQVEAPSADDNIDGLRQYVQPVNYTVLAPGFTASGIGGIDYDHDATTKSDKLTYLSPIMNGFQLGVSFTPDTGAADDLDGIGTDDVVDGAGRSYEIGARYEGQFNNVGVILGAGFSSTDLEEEDTTPAVGTDTDDRQAWNAGADFDIGPFGVGVAYVNDNFGDGDVDGVAGGDTIDNEETWVVGVDYTTGPFKLGASYLNQDNTGGIDEMETERYSGGVIYTVGSGVSFRGSIGVIDHENAASADFDATYATVGTQIDF